MCMIWGIQLCFQIIVVPSLYLQTRLIGCKKTVSILSTLILTSISWLGKIFYMYNYSIDIDNNAFDHVEHKMCLVLLLAGRRLQRKGKLITCSSLQWSRFRLEDWRSLSYWEHGSGLMGKFGLEEDFCNNLLSFNGLYISTLLAYSFQHFIPFYRYYRLPISPVQTFAFTSYITYCLYTLIT